ncbi:MAG: DUF4345 family protein [Myxococcota bacterium]
MLLSKITLGFTGILFVGYGLWCAVDPDVVAGYSGLVYETPGAATEVRAMYGGLEAGFGLFLLYGLANPAYRMPALMVTLFQVGGLVLCRTIGIALSGADAYNTGGAVIEGSITALAAASLWRVRHSGAPVTV